MRYLAFFIAVACTVAASPGLAVEAKAVRIAETWAVVGVISASAPDASVAVLRNNQTRRTYTLTVGDPLPNELGFALKAIKSRAVVVSAEKLEVTLGFAEASAAPAADESEEKMRTARFIDNYYRGLSEAPIEILRGGDDDAEFRDANSGLKFPLRHFGTLRDDAARSRFDLYKSDGNPDDAAREEAAERTGEAILDEAEFDSPVEIEDVPPPSLPREIENRQDVSDGAAATRTYDDRAVGGTDLRGPRGDSAAARDLLSN